MSTQTKLGYPPLGITVDSTDAELKSLADSMCYKAAVGMNPFVFASLVCFRRVLQLEREVQRLQTAPHLRNAEKR
jgi:hypothetical protein